MKTFAKYLSLAVGITALMMAAAPVAEAAWTQVTGGGARTSTLNNKSGHFEIIDNYIHALGQNGAIYKWSKSITDSAPLSGSWESVTGDGGTDVFKKTTTDPNTTGTGAFYILGGTGAVYRNDAGSWTQITKEARSSDNFGKSGHFEIVGGFIYALGGDGAVYKWNTGLSGEPNAVNGHWDMATASGGTDVFKIISDGAYYILGQNGAIFKYSGGSWVQITKEARSSDNFGKSGHFEIIDNYIHALGQNGAIYKWSKSITDSAPLSGSWESVTGDGGTDVFKKESDGKWYIMGQNGAIHRWDADAVTINPPGVDLKVTYNGVKNDGPITVNAGDSVQFTWLLSNAPPGAATYACLATSIPAVTNWDNTTKTASNEGTPVDMASITQTTTFTLKCNANGGAYGTSDSVTVNITGTGGASAPNITTCPGGVVTNASISWAAKTGETNYVVDIDDDADFNAPANDGFWNKTVIGTISTTAPAGFSGKAETLSFTTGSTYWVRVFYPVAGTHSLTAQFIAPASCASGTSAPTITPPLSPSSGAVGSLVTIAGTGFATANDAVKNTVNFGATAISNLVAPSTTSLIFSVPSVLVGTYNVSVTNANGTSNTAPFTVTTLGATGGLIVTLTPTPTSVNPNDSITVSWTVNQGTPGTTDWIGLFASGAGNTSYLSFQYATGATTGTKTFTAPATPGSYQFRYLPRNGYVDVGRSVAVLVQGDVTTAPSLTFTASPTAITTGQFSTLAWSFSDSAGTCTATRGTSGWAGSKSTSGGPLSVFPTVTTGFDLSCTNTATPSQTVSKSVDIVVTPTVSIQQCDTAAAAAKISEATAALAAGDYATASQLLGEATAILAGCGTVSPPGVPPPAYQLSDGAAVKTNAALYVRSSPEISSTNKLNGGLPLPIGVTGTITCSGAETTACPTIANGYVWWFVEWGSDAVAYDDGWSAEQAPNVTGLIVPATTVSTPPPPPPPPAGGTTPPPPPPLAGSITADISASATTLPIGTPVTLTWSSTVSGTTVAFCNVSIVVASAIGGGSSLLTPGGASGSTTYTLVDPGTKTFNVTCSDGLGVSDVDSVSVTWQSPTSSADQDEVLRRGLAQIAVGVQEVASTFEQLLKNLGR